MVPEVLTTKQMREVEDRAERYGFSRTLMMENAGRSVADVVRELYEPALHPEILAVCGTGNNGGDCVAAARHLASSSVVRVILLGRGDEVKTEESKLQWRVAKSYLKWVREADTLDKLLALRIYFNRADIILDGIFGTGVRAPLKEPHLTAINMINGSTALKVAVDLPSGLDPDTGEDCGLAVRADVTVTLHRLKQGLIGRRNLCGNIFTRSIGIPNNMID
jgi:NAD(P)H-hydrate epimerase